MLIINADDFGKTEKTNAAIVYCFEKGLCSSATIMANMPGFEQACRLARDKKLLDHIGLHLVLTTGYPLTQRIRRQSLFCDSNGKFKTARRRIIRLSASDKIALSEEIRAQISKCREFGLPITHVDSHHHVHEEWGIASILIKMMKEFKIPYIRIMANIVPDRTLIRRFYISGFNTLLKSFRISKTDCFGGIEAYLQYVKSKGTADLDRSSEICIHPSLDANNQVKDATVHEPVKTLLKQINGVDTAVSFRSARYEP